MKPSVLILLLVTVLSVSQLYAEEPDGSGFPDLLGDEQIFPDLLEDDMVSDQEDGEDDAFEASPDPIYDPLEPCNRVFFVFNDKLYFWVLKPVKDSYRALLPWDIRLCIDNFFSNLMAPVRLVNNLLQGELDDAGVVLSRFVINTTFGIAGLGDPAAIDFDLQARGADFGQTLGKWGVGEGLYLVLPVIGPSTLRDGVGMVGDAYLQPSQYIISDFEDILAWYAIDRVNSMSLGSDVYEDLKAIALDPYVASREAYYDYRKMLINKK